MYEPDAISRSVIRAKADVELNRLITRHDDFDAMWTSHQVVKHGLTFDFRNAHRHAIDDDVLHKVDGQDYAKRAVLESNMASTVRVHDEVHAETAVAKLRRTFQLYPI